MPLGRSDRVVGANRWREKVDPITDGVKLAVMVGYAVSAHVNGDGYPN